jgi:hypothetical protein
VPPSGEWSGRAFWRTFGPRRPRRFALPESKPGFRGYPEELHKRAEQVLNSTQLMEVVLHGHLLLEQALDILIQARLERTDVLGTVGSPAYVRSEGYRLRRPVRATG